MEKIVTEPTDKAYFIMSHPLVMAGEERQLQLYLRVDVAASITNVVV